MKLEISPPLSCPGKSGILFCATMQKVWVLTIGFLLIILGIGSFWYYSKKNPARAGLLAETTPVAEVYINDKKVGTTPYEASLSPGEITLRLVPVAEEVPLAPWGTKLSLEAGIQTVVRRSFAKTERESSGEVLSFEKIAKGETALTVISLPDGAEISIDGSLMGFTSKRINEIKSGEHKILVSSQGYKEREITARLEPGFRLTVVAMLAGEELLEDKTGLVLEETKEKKVKILATETGFLRVRAENSTSADEVAQVSPGKEFVLLEEKDDWFKIRYEEGKEGWISAKYAEKISSESSSKE